MAALEEDTITLFRKRAYDMAGVLGKTVKVGERGCCDDWGQNAARLGRSLSPVVAWPCACPTDRELGCPHPRRCPTTARCCL